MRRWLSAFAETYLSYKYHAWETYLVDLPLQLCDRRSISLSRDTFRQQRLLQLLHSLLQALLQQQIKCYGGIIRYRNYRKYKQTLCPIAHINSIIECVHICKLEFLVRDLVRNSYSGRKRRYTDFQLTSRRATQFRSPSVTFGGDIPERNSRYLSFKLP